MLTIFSFIFSGKHYSYREIINTCMPPKVSCLLCAISVTFSDSSIILKQDACFIHTLPVAEEIKPILVVLSNLSMTDC